MCFDAVETEQHFLLECNTRPAAEARTQLWDQLDRMVNEAAAKGAAAAPAASTLFNVAALSPSAQMTLMTGGGHPAITDRVLTRRVLSAILIALGSWLQTRKEHNERMREFEAMDEPPEVEDAPSTPSE